MRRHTCGMSQTPDTDQWGDKTLGSICSRVAVTMSAWLCLNCFGALESLGDIISRLAESLRFKSSALGFKSSCVPATALTYLWSAVLQQKQALSLPPRAPSPAQACDSRSFSLCLQRRLQKQYLFSNSICLFAFFFFLNNFKS